MMLSQTLLRAVKRASTYAEVNARTGGVAVESEPSTVVQIHSLHTEMAQQNLVRPFHFLLSESAH